MKTNTITNDKINAIASYLAELEPGYLPTPIFDQFCRLATIATIQFIPLRKREDGVVQVLLIPREAGNSFYPGWWHNPGTVVRQTDTFSTVSTRLLEEELGGVHLKSNPKFVESRIHKTMRGQEMLQIYRIEISEEPVVGKFFDVNDLPNKTVDTEIDAIKIALQDFRQTTP